MVNTKEKAVKIVGDVLVKSATFYGKNFDKNIDAVTYNAVEVLKMVREGKTDKMIEDGLSELNKDLILFRMYFEHKKNTPNL